MNPFLRLLVSLSVAVTTSTSVYLAVPRLPLFKVVGQTVTIKEPEPLPNQAVNAVSFLDQQVVIKPALISNGIWQVYEYSAAWLSTSAEPGNVGNIIMYAHNSPALFGRLDHLNSGDEVKVTWQGKEYLFLVTENIEVTATEVDRVMNVSHGLTLYTCEGSFDQKRRVVYAELKI